MKKVALIEDNPDNRLLIRVLFEDRYELVEFADGASALAAIAAEPPDLVLLDVSLPGMDGCEVLARLRGDLGLHALPVIALTAHAMVGDRERLLGEGFDDYVAKPIADEDVLFGALDRLLARGETTR